MKESNNKYKVTYKNEGLVPAIILADKLKIDNGQIIFMVETEPAKYRIVAIINQDTIREVLEVKYN